jgi:hypothetical protein
MDPKIFQQCGAMHLGFLDRISVILLRISPSYDYDGSNPCILNFSQLRCTPPGVLCAMDWAPSSQVDDSCWTCRRRRWKCDRTLPSCRKCATAEQHCLGYAKERPLRWTNSVASRGKLMGKTVPRQANFFSIRRLLVDPGLQDLPVRTRGYIAYCKWNGWICTEDIC